MKEIQYVDDGLRAIFDNKSFRLDKRTGYYLSSTNGEDGKRKRLHIYVWEKHNGKVPEGHHIHHIDHDKSNNEISNLQIMTEHEHLSHHARTMTEETRKKKRNNLIENAVPKSKAWHKSEAGRKWHSENSKKQWKKAKEIEYECTNCGKKFKSRHRYGESSNRFCCNACKSAYRRKAGLDEIVVICDQCGNSYKTNRYQIKRCPKCTNAYM